MTDKFYSYPDSVGDVRVGAQVTVGANKTVYTITKLIVRNSDGHTYAFLRSAKSRQSTYRLDKLVPVAT